MNEILQAPAEVWALVCLAAFAAGFIDAVVGGGGLIQTPMLLISFPHTPVATLLGTSKIPAFSGTSIAAYQYSKKVPLQWRVVGRIALAAFAAAMLGSRMASLLSNDIIKPIILVVLAAIGIFTFTRKTMGLQPKQPIAESGAIMKGVLWGLLIGFYDGFIGPGTGTFLVLLFISILQQDFLHASAHAKIVNLATNLASILYFSATGHVVFQLALPMAAANMLGGYCGSKMAILRGNRFIRIVFLCVITGTILRFAYDIFLK